MWIKKEIHQACTMDWGSVFLDTPNSFYIDNNIFMLYIGKLIKTYTGTSLKNVHL